MVAFIIKINNKRPAFAGLLFVLINLNIGRMLFQMHCRSPLARNHWCSYFPKKNAHFQTGVSTIHKTHCVGVLQEPWNMPLPDSKEMEFSAALQAFGQNNLPRVGTTAVGAPKSFLGIRRCFLQRGFSSSGETRTYERELIRALGNQVNAISC